MKEKLSSSKPSQIVFTIGHSTKTLQELINTLVTLKIKKIVDIRTIPRSRHNPQFNKETLPAALEAVGIGYVHMQGLGGLRHTETDSPNKGWRNASFRGFADYMQTIEFEENLGILTKLAIEERVVIMCAETLPWRCHRSLISDALFIRGFEVEHIMSREKSQRHKLTPWIKIEGTKITYPEKTKTRFQRQQLSGALKPNRQDLINLLNF